MTEKRRLGRGLDALLGGVAAPASAEAATAAPGPTSQLPLDQIHVNPRQPRKDFDPDDLNTLKESLATHGLLQPVVVRPTGDGYQLIAGERRYRAAKEVGWKEIPVRVVDFNDQQVYEAALVENIQRTDLNPIEKAQGFQDYLTQYKVTQEELAKKIGLDRSTISNLVRLLELPPAVQDAVRLGQISNGHARALLALDDSDRQTAVCKEIIAKGLSVRAVEALVKQGKPEEEGKERKPAAEKTAHVQGIEDELRQSFATRVEIKLKAQDKGQIVIGFQSNEEFERVLGILRRERAA
jgi:ParB family chromosome partitioning protein